MADRFELQRHVLGPLLTYGLWSWSHHVFRPAQMAKSLGQYHPHTMGLPPTPRRLAGGGPVLSKQFAQPLLLDENPSHYDSVVEFDHCAEDYELAVKPFSQPVFDELVTLLLPHLVPDARLLDPSCGPGIEALQLAKLVPDGEVVAADLSRGMVETACRNARREGLSNMAFVQADVGQPPAVFESYFDAVACCLAFHHYPDGAAAVRAWARVLKPGGMAFVADPGPKWFNDMSQGWAKLADPGFVQHRTGAEFQALFRQAGFREVFWVEALPGIGITVAAL